MSQIETCPQCDAKCKVRRSDSETSLKTAKGKVTKSKLTQRITCPGTTSKIAHFKNSQTWANRLGLAVSEWFKKLN